MGLYIKKQFPFSMEPIDCYLKITDVYFETSDKEEWKVKYNIFSDKNISDILKIFLYISTVWMVQQDNSIKMTVDATEWLDNNLFQPVSKIAAIEEGIVLLPSTFSFYDQKSFHELMNIIYEDLKTNCSLIDASYVADDIETKEQFEERALNPFLADLNKKIGD